MLTPEDVKELKAKFEAIHHRIGVALDESEQEITEEACGHYIAALLLMEELVEEVTQEEGHSVKEALKRVAGAANSPEGVGAAGGLGGAAAALSFTRSWRFWRSCRRNCCWNIGIGRSHSGFRRRSPCRCGRVISGV